MVKKMSIVLKNAFVIRDFDSDPEQMDMEIEKGRIKRIQKDIKSQNYIDLTGKMIMPGFVNTHTHAAMVLARGIADDVPFDKWLYEFVLPFEDKLDEEAVYWATLVAQMEMARKGIIAFLDMYFHSEMVAQAVVDFGMKAVITRGLVDDGSGNDQGRLEENLQLFEKWNGYKDLVRVGFGPHAMYSCSQGYLKKISDIAFECDAPVTIHFAETVGESDFSLRDLFNCGFDRNHLILAHCVHISPDDLKQLKSDHIYVSHNPSSNMKLSNGIARISEMLKEGVNISLGTDGAASNNSLDIWHEMRLAVLAQRAMNFGIIPSSEALKMATFNGARTLGIASGQIKEGSDADFTVVDIDKTWYKPLCEINSHLVHAGNSCDVFATMVKGRWIYFDGHFPTVDESRVVNKFMEVLKRLRDTGS